MTEHFFNSSRCKTAESKTAESKTTESPVRLRTLRDVRTRAADLGSRAGTEIGTSARKLGDRSRELGASARNWFGGLDAPSRRTGALSIAAAVALGGLVTGTAGAAEPDLQIERHVVVTELSADWTGNGATGNGAAGTGAAGNEAAGNGPDSPSQADPAAPAAAEAAPAPEPAPEPPAEPAPEPVQGPVPPVDDMVVTSPFGNRNNPLAPGSLEFHTGTDFGAVTGTPVKAMLGGTVTEAGWHTTGGGGLRVVIDHGDGVQTTYNHLSSIDVSVGQTVDAATVVGGVGSTGNSTGPHLHFEVLRHGDYEDPMGWL